MQLKLTFLEPVEPRPDAMPARPSQPTDWEQLDETARIAALRKLAILIARMLATEPAEEVGND
jgi:hypothetical protein